MGNLFQAGWNTPTDQHLLSFHKFGSRATSNQMASASVITTPLAFNRSTTAFICIDIQKGFTHPTFWGGKRSNPDFETNVSRLLNSFRSATLPIYHVVHHSKSSDSLLNPCSPGVEFQDFAAPQPGEQICKKSVNSCFVDSEPNLERLLRDRGIGTIVLAGLTTDHCVNTTARHGANLGFRVIFVEDATATWERGPYNAELVGKVAVESLRGEFAEICSTAEMEDVVKRSLARV